MRKIIIIVFVFISAAVSTPSFAAEAQMKEALVKIVNQLQRIKPLIEQARKEQPKNSRIKIHFNQFRDADGKLQNGLKQDIAQIQDALITAINKEAIEPRRFDPIKNDFIGRSHE